MAEATNGHEVDIYHERQRLQMCAIHAVNNLFQGTQIVNKEEMNEVCKELSPTSWLNPHMSALGVGNYDINAIMAVLSKRGYDIIWFDKRRSPDDINVDNVYGILINTVTKLKAFGYKVSLTMFRHWYSIRKIDNLYYNLDSKLKQPEKIGDSAELKLYLKSKLCESKTELLLVVDKDVAETRSWENHTTAESPKVGK